MTLPFPEVPIGRVANPVSRPEVPVPGSSYRLIGVRLWGQGAHERETIDGSQTKYSTLSRMEAGDIVVNKIWARHGSVSVIGTDLAGCYGSNEFPTFAPIPHLLDPDWFYWITKTKWFWEKCDEKSRGTSGQNRIRPERFLEIRIPLPPLDEQRRIVSRIEELAAKIEEAQSLKAHTLKESQFFWKVLSRMARESDGPIVTLGDVVEFLDGQRIPLSRGQRSSRSGPFPYYGASGIIDYIDDYIFDEQLLLLSEDGANLLNRSTPIAFVADGKYWVNNHAHVLKPLHNVADIRYLEYALSDYDVSVFNFASAQAKLNQRYARQITIPLPPLVDQQRIVSALDRLRSHSDKLHVFQTQSSAELDALLPAVIDKALRGEL